MRRHVQYTALVNLTRGGTLECQHAGAIAVVNSRGELRAQVGDPHWLLMSQDRVHSDSFHITHAFLAYGTCAALAPPSLPAPCSGGGLIEYHRGKLTVPDRPGFEPAACNCYATDQRTQAQLRA